MLCNLPSSHLIMWNIFIRFFIYFFEVTSLLHSKVMAMFLWLHCCYYMNFGFQERKKTVKICFKQHWFLWAVEPPKRCKDSCRSYRWLISVCLLISVISLVPFFRVIPGKHFFKSINQIQCWNPQTFLPVLLQAAFSECHRGWISRDILCTTFSFTKAMN